MKESVKRIVRVGAAVGAVSSSVFLWSMFTAAPLHAQGKSCTIPKNFGSLKGAAGPGLLFEAADGTIRVIFEGCKVGLTLARE